MPNKKVEIEKIYIDGFLNSKIRIKGKYLKKTKLTLKIDNKTIPLLENITLDKKYVIEKIKKTDTIDINLYAKISKKSKKNGIIY